MINRTSKYRESIILLFSTLIISPIFDFYLGTVGGLNLWMVGGILYNLILIREIIGAYIKYKSLSIILIFTLSYSLIETIISENVLLQYSLFIISFNVFISLVSISNKSSMKLLPILNTFLIIICFYGIYQFIANIYNLPFTGKEIYRGRETADFVQISIFIL